MKIGGEYGGKVSNMFGNCFIFGFGHTNLISSPKTKCWLRKVNFGIPKTDFGVLKRPPLRPEKPILGPRSLYLGPRICLKAIFCRCGMPQTLFFLKKLHFWILRTCQIWRNCIFARIWLILSPKVPYLGPTKSISSWNIPFYWESRCYQELWSWKYQESRWRQKLYYCD